MSATGLDVFDKSEQSTNVWLNHIARELAIGRHEAWHVLRAVLHALRDRLTPEQMAHMSAQLPLLVRGLFFEEWRLSQVLAKMRTEQEFLDHLASRTSYADKKKAAICIFGVLDSHIGADFRKIVSTLPPPLKALAKQAEAVAPSALDWE